MGTGRHRSTGQKSGACPHASGAHARSVDGAGGSHSAAILPQHRHVGRAHPVAPGPGQVIVAELVVTPGVDLLADVLCQSLLEQVLGGVLGGQVTRSVRGQVGPTEQRAPPWETLSNLSFLELRLPQDPAHTLGPLRYGATTPSHTCHYRVSSSP